MAYTATDVKNLRERTGAGMMDCKKALDEAGGDFAALARKHSQDPIRAKNGGDLGWRRLDRPGLPDKKLTDALAALEPGGKPSAVIETGRGYYLLQVTAKREGDLAFDQVKQEIASTMAKEHLAREEARKDAETALAEVKAGKKLSDLFEELDRLTPEDAQRMRDTLAEIGEGHLGEAYLELTELVGRDTALAMLLDEMLGPVILPDGSMVARNSIAKIAPNKLN